MIESNPSGAEVWIDGKPIGNLTPCKVFLEMGNREIELFLSRYESFKEKYYVAGPTFIIAELKMLRDDSSNDGDFSADIDSKNIQAKLIAERPEGEDMPSKESARMPAIPIWCSILSIALACHLAISRNNRLR